MSKRKLIVNIYFNTFKWSPDRLTKPWIENRLNLFFKYTLPCLEAQTLQDFTAYIYCDIKSMDIVRECLKTRKTLPKNVIFSDTDTIKKQIRQEIVSYDELYMVRIDSDNMYAKDYMQRLKDYKQKPETQALISQNGYMFDDNTKKFVYYYMESPSFFTFIYKVKDYLDNKLYYVPGGHAYVFSTLKCEVVPGRNYLISIHDDNISFKNSRLKGMKEVENRQQVFQEFGVKTL